MCILSQTFYEFYDSWYDVKQWMIRPVVTYSSETWTLTAKDENNPRIFKRQILKKIFGPVNVDSVWRIRNNMETDNLIEGEIH
jgi:hypothetical protein